MTQVFRSKIEDLVETEELHIRQEPAFGKYRHLFPAAAREHPAKYCPALVEYLVDKYTQPGDTILDCLAGTGLLGVVSALKGRNAVQVELEPRYFEWMEKARENVEKLNTLTEKGKILNILGDSRRLTELLAERVGAVITSPPFGDVNLSAGDPERRRERLIAAGHDPKDFLGGSARNAVLKHYGQADAVIVSPPYERGLSHERHHTPNTGSAEKLQAEKHLYNYPAGSKDNIGNLPLGPVDVVITSPPYADSKKGKADAEKMAERWDKAFREHAETWNSWGMTWKTPGRLRALKALGSGYSENPDNIGNLAFGDATQLSQPQEDLQQLYKRLLTKNDRPTYLSEMLLVYKNMFETLRPGGVACVVVKPFVKDRKVVDLPYITWCLLRAVGFVLEKAYKWRIERPSFWRVLYLKRFPEVPQVSHEYVIVVRKPGGSGT